MAMKKIIRTEENSLLNIKSIKNTTNITIENEEDMFECEEFYFTDVYDDKAIKSFIKSCEKNIRKSTYYSQYIGTLKENYNITNCAVMGNISCDMVDVEMHHYPFSLYDIVMLNVLRCVDKDIKMTTFSVSYNVLKDHFDNIIPLVPLSKTAHELAHDGEISISLRQIFGNIEAFIEKYKDYMSDALKIKFNKLVEYTENADKMYSANSETLSVKKMTDFEDNSFTDISF